MSRPRSLPNEEHQISRTMLNQVSAAVVGLAFASPDAAAWWEADEVPEVFLAVQVRYDLRLGDYAADPNNPTNHEMLRCARLVFEKLTTIIDAALIE